MLLCRTLFLDNANRLRKDRYTVSTKALDEHFSKNVVASELHVLLHYCYCKGAATLLQSLETGV